MTGLHLNWTPSKLLASTFRDLGSPDDVKRQFKSYLLSNPKCLASLLQMLYAETGKTGVYDYSLPIDMHAFLHAEPVLGNMLLRYPGVLLSPLEEAIIAAQKDILSSIQNLTQNNISSNEDCIHTTNHSHQPHVNPTIKGINATRVHARLIHLPPHTSNCKPSLSNLNSSDVGKILQLSGTVVRCSKVQMYESQRSYECSSKHKGCGVRFTVRADLHQCNNALVEPSRCPTPHCPGKKFILIQDETTRSDYQEIKVQESVVRNNSHSRTGVIPRALLIKLQNDLVDQCMPGDDVVVVGTLISHWQHLQPMAEIDINMAMHAHSIRVVHGSEQAGGAGGGSGNSSSWDCIFDDNHNSIDDNNDNQRSEHRNGMVREEIVKEFTQFWQEDINKKRPIAARNFICSAVCPTVYGVSLIKLALLLTLIGGCSAGHKNGSDQGSKDSPYGVDGNSHVVDQEDHDDTPVQFSLGEVDSSHPMDSRQPNQKKEGGSNARVETRRREQSHLLLCGDPGTAKSQFLRFSAALCPRSVLTSGSGTTSAGLTCAAVREDSGKEWTLEAGALVLADRGVCAIDEFSCIAEKDRTTIHEAMEQQTLSVAKAGIVCKLNCRATVIAVCNAKGGFYDHDKPFTVNVGIEPPLLSRFDLVFKLIDGSDAEKDDNVATFLLNRAIQGSGYDCTKPMGQSKRANWTIDKLRAYIAVAKSRFHPTISSEASTLLEMHYSECRSSEYIEIQVTVRLLESLIRLAQAHARLMYRSVVEIDDAIAVILLMESSVASTSASSFNSLYADPATTIFPNDDSADIEFLLDKHKVLQKYNMLHCLNDTECQRLEEHSRKMKQLSVNFGENKGEGKPPNAPQNNSWNAIGSSQSFPYLTPSQKTTSLLTQDHYGRYTQKSTPSPSTSTLYRHQNPELFFENNDPVSKRRKSNHSAD
jgi:DNA helicase MCM9